jgi:hypothetical protein
VNYLSSTGVEAKIGPRLPIDTMKSTTSLGTVNRVLRVRSHSFYSANPPCVCSNNRVSVQFVPKRVHLSSSDKRGDAIISHFPIVLFQNDDSTNPAMKTACEPGSWPVL